MLWRGRYEIERACTQAVKFVDDTTLEVESTRGTKQFIFDTCFTMDSTQDQVFAVRIKNITTQA